VRLLAVLLVAAAACIGQRGSGTARTERRPVSEFAEVQISGSMTLELTSGSPPAVEVTADDNLLPLIATEVNARRLVVRVTKEIAPRTNIVVRASTPEIEGIVASGASVVNARGVKTDDLDVSTTGSAKVRLEGEARRFDALISGAAWIDASALRSHTARIRVSGSGAIDVFVTGELEVDVSGSGSVRYAGNPLKVRQKVSGSGTVQKR
jgi:hypothetical protein